jgi:hypothetical protein
VTGPRPQRTRRRGAWPRKAWGTCVVAGLLLMTLAIVLNIDHSRPGRSGHAVALVNLGRLPTEKGVPATTSRTGAARRQSTRTRFAPGAHLRLQRLGLDAPIRAVTTVGNVMQIPRDPHTVGWWNGGSAPGDTVGTTVIVGHINFAGVSGALAALPDARPGDAVVIDEGHHDRRYRVVAIRSYPKSTGIPGGVFTRTGRARLVLITCGGPFDSSTGNYEDNIVAYAEPA